MKKIEKPSKVGKPGAKEAAAAKAADHAVDASRGSDAAVNKQPVMSFADAMALRSRGELRKSVLTPEGWVCGLPAGGVRQ